jgi:hypothetical protein
VLIHGSVERSTSLAVLFRISFRQECPVPHPLLGQQLWLPLSVVSAPDEGQEPPDDLMVEDWLIPRLCEQIRQAA